MRSYRRFADCQGIILEWKNELYSYPVELKKSINGPGGCTQEKEGAEAFDKGNTIKEFPLESGRLIFVDPGKSADKRTLKFLARELEEGIQLATTFDSIFNAVKTISSDLRLRPLLDRIMSLSEEILNVEVSSVILLNREKKELYWEISRGEGSDFFRENVTIPLGEGIAGTVAQNGKPVLLNDVYSDGRWCPSYDWKSGFRTRSMLCVPIEYHGRILGVIEAINKKKGKFTTYDLSVLDCIASQAAVAIENARIYEELDEAYEELKALDKARKKVINHLSHEIKTPLAILGGVVRKLSDELDRLRIRGLDNTLNRGRRNLSRLFDLQEKIDDILHAGNHVEQDKLIGLVEKASSLIEGANEEVRSKHGELLDIITELIKSTFQTEKIHVEGIPLREFMDQVCDEAAFLMGRRDLHIIRKFEKDIILRMDKGVLKKVCQGLLKNAIENTPDQGKIEVSTRSTEKDIWIEFRDFGIGITPENQKMIFGGFFHTQDTDSYTSKKPYEFSAGGSGADLLRTKVFSERFGFSVRLDSTRCGYIPEDTDICPGKISLCKFVEERTECFSSGGSTFLLKFSKAAQG